LLKNKKGGSSVHERSTEEIKMEKTADQKIGLLPYRGRGTISITEKGI